MIERISDIGNIRKLNEDTYGVLEDPRFNLFVICDGMGGHNAGEVASALAKDTVLSSTAKDFHGEHPLEVLVGALYEANRLIHTQAMGERTLSGMGTTVTAALSYGGKLYVAHVGDSSLYQIRDGGILKITRDHSLVQELVDQGKLAPEDAKHHPNKNIITRAVGTNGEVTADTWVLDTQEEDIYILCTDGLTDYLADEEILDAITHHQDQKDSMIALANLAKERGGKDNITLVIFGGEALK